LAPPGGWVLIWAAFADGWRSKYQPAMQKVREGNIGWVKLDDLHHANLL
jgi:2-haloacid dehalogenase